MARHSNTPSYAPGARRLVVKPVQRGVCSEMRGVGAPIVGRAFGNPWVGREGQHGPTQVDDSILGEQPTAMGRQRHFTASTSGHSISCRRWLARRFLVRPLWRIDRHAQTRGAACSGLEPGHRTHLTQLVGQFPPVRRVNASWPAGSPVACGGSPTDDVTEMLEPVALRLAHRFVGCAPGDEDGDDQRVPDCGHEHAP